MQHYTNQLLAILQEAKQELQNTINELGSVSFLAPSNSLLSIEEPPFTAPNGQDIEEIFNEGFVTSDGTIYFFEALGFYEQVQLIDFFLENFF